MRILPFLLALACLPEPSHAAERHFGITGFQKIRVDGPYRVEVVVGQPPFATAVGSNAAIDRLSITVQGQTLVIRPAPVAVDPSGAPAGAVTIRVGVHELGAAALNGAGMMNVTGVRGLLFNLAIAGSGAASVTGEVDRWKVGVQGSGSARLGGTGGRVEASLKGTSALDAAALAVKDLVLVAEGPATATLHASDSVTINANGPATINVTGGAACKISGSSSASVTGCK